MQKSGNIPINWKNFILWPRMCWCCISLCKSLGTWWWYQTFWLVLVFRGNLGSNPSTRGNRDLQPNTNSGCVGPIRPDVFESWEPTIWDFTEICKSFTNLLPPPTKPQTLREVVSVPPKICRLRRKFYWEKHERPNIFLFCLIHVANPVLPWLTSVRCSRIHDIIYCSFWAESAN